MPFTNQPISELIDGNIQTTLQNVVAGPTYQVTLSSVMFPDPSGNTPPADMQCIIHVGDDQEDPDDVTPLGMKQWRRTYAIQIYIMKTVAELQATRFETWKNTVRADVEKALLADVNRTVNTVPLAANTEVHDPITFEDANDAQGIFVICEVTYRTNFLDPYSQTSSEE